MRLGEVADLQRSAQDHLACQRLQLSQDGLQEGGLACAVGSDQGSALAAAQFDIGRGEQQLLWKADLQSVRAYDQVAGALMRRELQVQARQRPHGRSQGAHAPFGLSGAKGLVVTVMSSLTSIHLL